VYFFAADGGKSTDVCHMPVWRHHLSTEIESISFDRDGGAISMFVHISRGIRILEAENCEPFIKDLSSV
jgi:hypothetical protein